MYFLYNFEYNKLKLKEVVLLIPKNHSNLTSMLTPALALHGISIKEFILEFEKISIHLEYDLIVPVIVNISKIKTFEIRLKTVALNNLLNIYNEIDKNKQILNVLFVYKIYLLKSIDFNRYKKSSLITYKNLKNYLEYFNSTIKIKKLISNCKLSLTPRNNPFLFNYGLILNFINYNSINLNYLRISALLHNVKLQKITNSLYSSSLIKLKGYNFLL
jgi:ribosomal protein L11